MVAVAIGRADKKGRGTKEEEDKRRGRKKKKVKRENFAMLLSTWHTTWVRTWSNKSLNLNDTINQVKGS